MSKNPSVQINKTICCCLDNVYQNITFWDKLQYYHDGISPEKQFLKKLIMTKMIGYFMAKTLQSQNLVFIDEC
jgi:hypothetical protein